MDRCQEKYNIAITQCDCNVPTAFYCIQKQKHRGGAIQACSLYQYKYAQLEPYASKVRLENCNSQPT